MLGNRVGLQDRLFYAFDLADRVPNDHLLRGLATDVVCTLIMPSFKLL